MSKTIITEVDGHVAKIQLNRPEALNALNLDLLHELSSFIDELNAKSDVKCIILYGSEKAFAAGADIKEMQERTFVNMYLEDMFGGWEKVSKIRIPIIAAVSGYALGGGFELALMCDTIIASDNAQFGLPEVKLGIIPGMGGTQRLVKAVGKAKAIELILTGRMIDAEYAEKSGIIARIVPNDKLLEEAMETAKQIASYSKVAVMSAKESINRNFEVPLAEGLLFERRIFHSLFATLDQKEGMRAFSEKRKPEFKDK